MTEAGGEGTVRPLRAGLRAWLAGPAGRRLLEEERRVLDEVLQGLFGYYLVQLGAAPEDLIAGSRVRHRWVLDTGPGGGEGAPHALALPEALPVGTDLVDVVLLHHVLEFSEDPHQVLREVERVLIPEGHVVVVAFNPWSLWGGWRLLRRSFRRQEEAPWSGRFLAPGRLKDWLGLLGLEPVLLRPVLFRPPGLGEGLARRMAPVARCAERWTPFLAGVAVLVARKRVATLTPIRPRWRPRRSLLPVARPKVARPTASAQEGRG